MNDNDDDKPIFTTTTELPHFVLAPDFGDAEALLNSRDWLQKALEAQGAKITGKGIGMGAADLDIELEGHRYNITVRPIVSEPPQA